MWFWNYVIFNYADMQVWTYESLQICKLTSMQVFRYASMKVCKNASMQVFKYPHFLGAKAPLGLAHVRETRKCQTQKVFRSCNRIYKLPFLLIIFVWECLWGCFKDTKRVFQEFSQCVPSFFLGAKAPLWLAHVTVTVTCETKKV